MATIKRRGMVATVTAKGKVRSFSNDGNGTATKTGRHSPKSNPKPRSSESVNKSRLNTRKK